MADAVSPSPSPKPSELFPKEVIDVLNADFLGFKLWHLLVLSLMIPSPMMFVFIFMIIPGFKEKATEVIRNVFPGVYSGIFGRS